jgi:hypothetical protein
MWLLGTVHWCQLLELTNGRCGGVLEDRRPADQKRTLSADFPLKRVSKKFQGTKGNAAHSN